jgi:hypothetical protein
MRSVKWWCSAAALASLLGPACKPFIAPHKDGGADAAVDVQEVRTESDAGDSTLAEAVGPEVASNADASCDSSVAVSDAAGLSDSGSFELGPKDTAEAPQPIQLPKTGLVTQLEADYGLVVSADNLVSKWRDRSGNAFDASESDPSLEPVFLKDPSGEFGAVAFGIIPGSDLLLPSGFSDLATGLSLFFVVSIQNTTGDAVLLSTSPNGPILNLASDSGAGTVSVGYYVGMGTTTAGRVDNFAYGLFHLVEVVQEGGSVGGTSPFTVYLDGSALVTATQRVSTSEIKTAQLGPALDQALIFMQAALIYSRPVSNEERRQIEQYLMSKWHVSP